MIVVTGANGFIGSALVNELALKGKAVKALSRTTPGQKPPGVICETVTDINPDTDWRTLLDGASSVIHCAARVHIMRQSSADALSTYRSMNSDASCNLALQAAEAGIKRFILISSIKVNGESTVTGSPFAPEVQSCPDDPYGASKFEAEQGLLEIAVNTGMEVVCIRPPLVYGPGVKANFLSMMHWLKKGVPLPLGAVVDNRRSLVGLDNLIDLIITCLDHPAASNEIFLVSDDEDLSTTELLRRMGKALGKRPYLLPVPPAALLIAAKLLRKEHIAQRLLSNLQIDLSKTKTLLDWTPPISVDQGLKKTADWFLQNEKML